MAATYNSYYCEYDTATQTSSLHFHSTNGSSPVTNDSVFYAKSHLTLSSNGGLLYEYKYSEKNLDFAASTCSQFTYQQPWEDTDKTTGAWNYNSATGKMVLVIEFDDNGTPSLDAWEYKVQKLSGTHFILSEELSGSDFHLRFEK